ncbi:MAG TPA: prepilin-type N-terminal cleavage/methylation domain-containing protein [Gemmatimonadaceae bacterium]|nr:prepilin-type N-terminal cleavage/methylation domain-containing protein [Gemmatimonadaceae bacterium]
MTRRAFTLLEVVITVAMLGVLAAVANLALRRVERPDPADPRTILADSLPVAVREARAITLVMPTDSGVRVATLHPDGSIVADSALALERFIGIRADTIRPHGRH